MDYSFLFDRYKTSSFSQEDVEMINEILACTNSYDLREYAEEYERLSSIEIPDDDEEDQNTQDALINHWNLYTDLSGSTKTKEEAIRDYCYNQGFLHPSAIESELERYFPAEYKKDIPKSGAWIMITEDIAVENKPQQYSVYYALPAPIKMSIPYSLYATSRKFEAKYHKAKIQTEKGEVCVWPHEYIKIPVEAVLEEVDNSFDKVLLGGAVSYDADKEHFLRMRGIEPVIIQKLLLESINSINYMYFKIRPEAFEFWDFYISALKKGIDPRMAIKLWESKTR